MQRYPDPEKEGDRLPAELPPPRVRGLTRRVWNPSPLPKPAIPADLERLDWPERTASVVAHAMLSIEHWLSGSGWLREWIRLNLWVGIFMLVATLVVVPPVTALLEGVRDWTGLLGATVENINVAVATLPPLVLSLATAFVAVKLILRYRANRRPNRRQDYDHYS